MNRIVSLMAASAVTAFCVLPSQAAEYRDPSGRFTVSVPEGWESAKPDNAETVTVIIATPESSAQLTGAACIGIYLSTPSTKSSSQAELNSAAEGVLTKEFWQDALKSSGDDDVTIQSTGSRDQSGRRIHNVVFTGKTVEEGKTVTAKGKMEMHFIPGSLHTLMCVSEEPSYASYSPAFETVFLSYKPDTPAIVASADHKPGSVLTMFSGTGYNGAARVLGQDTPDLPAAGWIANAGSLAVDGTHSWEVCDGANYTGKCQVVGGQRTASDGQSFNVLSARRLTSRQSLEAAVATSLRRASVEAHLRLSK